MEKYCECERPINVKGRCVICRELVSSEPDVYFCQIINLNQAHLTKCKLSQRSIHWSHHPMAREITKGQYLALQEFGITQKTLEYLDNKTYPWK